MDLVRALLALPEGASSFADGIDLLHLFVISVTMLVSTIVFAMAIVFCVRHRRWTAGEVTAPAVASLRVEVALITTILTVFIGWWVIGFSQFVRMRTPPADAEIIHVTPKQWMWKFEYANGRATNDVLIVPVDRAVRIVMTSRDVIHSFFIPAFRVKQDVVPGQYQELWFRAVKTGTYPLFCAEYCGLAHSRMRAEVRVLTQADYAAWIGAGGSTTTPLLTQGADVAERRGCLACHTLDGQPHVGPTWSRLYGKRVALADGREVIADDAYLTRSMMEPGAELVAGYRALMPTYLGALAPAETSALLELIRSLRDGEVPAGVTLPRLTVQPAGPTSPQAPLGPALPTEPSSDGGLP